MDQRDRIDVLDPFDTTRLAVLRGDTLDPAPDHRLQELVGEAGQLGAAWALVTLLLRHTQLFRAHEGLPGELATLRTIHRGASFCQYVVRDATPVEITDAAVDPRAPQELVRRFDIRSYLGAPVTVGGVVVGALCIYCTRPRVFDDRDRAVIGSLARAASERLVELASRQRPRNALLEYALRPAFAELNDAMGPLATRIANAQLAMKALAAQAAEGRVDSITALDQLQAAIEGIEQVSARMRNGIAALEGLGSGGPTVRIDEVVHASDKLAQHHTRLIGGVRWQLDSPTTPLAASRTSSVTTVAAALSLVAQRMNRANDSSGIAANVGRASDHIEIEIGAPMVPAWQAECAGTLMDFADPAISITERESGLCIAIPTAPA